MGTVLTVRYDDIPAGRAIGADMFADLGATACFARDAADDGVMVVTLDVDLSPADAETARMRLVTRTDAEAVAAKDVDAATPLAWSPTATTTAQQIAELRAQVATLTDLFNAVAALVKRA